MAHATTHLTSGARGVGTLPLTCLRHHPAHRPIHRPSIGTSVTRGIKALLLAWVLIGTWPRPAAAQQAVEPDLMSILSAVVAVEALVPDDARTAAILGDERIGTGIVIDGAGLVVTIGYLVLEAADVRIRTGGGQRVPADVLAYDHETGFGLLRARTPLDRVVPMALGDSDALVEGTPAVIASYGGPGALQPVMTVSRREFAGYWEYLLDDAIFTSPPYRYFGGAALMSTDGRLVGVGSLIVPDAAREASRSPGNMFVPIARLKAVLGDLIASGRSAIPARPWLGIYAVENEAGAVVVRGLADEGPAQAAGIEPGDVIVSAGDARVRGLADFYRTLWNDRGPDDRVILTVERGGESRDVAVRTGDRYRWLRLGDR